MNALAWDRLQFGFTATYHYLFPQLTMGLSLMLVLMKGMALRTREKHWDELTRFWARIFGLNFVMGVVTGIPLEFQFGTNWARFADGAGGVVGLTLAMEGMFAFFAESAFIGLFLFGEKRLGPRGHFVSALMVFLGSWLSGYFITVTNAFMQHPVGYATQADGRLVLVDLGAYLGSSWALWQYAHTMSGAATVGAFAVTGLGAYWALMGRHEAHARAALRVGVIVGLVVCIVQLFPTGDAHGHMVANNQPAALAAMEGRFKTGDHAELALVGQPNVDEHRLENPIVVPSVLSYLAYGSFGAKVKGLDDYSPDDRPDHVELLYFAYHIMVGLGTIFIALMLAAAIQLWRGRLAHSRRLLWLLMLAVPFPFIANTAGWITAELGRQPWSVYGLLRTAHAASPTVGTGDVAFTVIGYMGLYLLLGVLFLWLVGRAAARGPVPIELRPLVHATTPA
jgi:cytochrome d ubiquinol oxidase subunit I